jgi:SAM-dependent methyltransferase
MAIENPQPLSEEEELGQWMYERIMPFAKGNILEIGSGSGSISNIFIRNGIPIVLTDSDTYYCRRLRKKFEQECMVKDIRQLSLFHSTFEEIYGDLLGRFDMVFALNVVEHVALNKAAIANVKKLLASGGYLILSQPAYTALYNELNQGLNRWHKHNKLSIKKLLNNDFEIVKMRYFNLVGLVMRFLSSSSLGFNMINSERQNEYNKVVPLFQIEDLAFKQIGLSVITVAQKK